MRYVVTTILVLMLMLGRAGLAYSQEPDPEGAPVAAEPEVREGAQAYRAVTSYYSPNLRANFHTQWMYIESHQGRVTFWGARIVGLADDSPLQSLNLNLGDVVTRLDGIRISERMRKRRDPNSGEIYWQLPEMERHYGRTEVRYIITGTHRVHRGEVDLGPLNGDETDDDGPILP